MKVKIKSWKELHGIKLNGEYVIDAETFKPFVIALRHKEYDDVWLSYVGIGEERILKILAVMGLKVEFEKEPTITQNDYNWLVAMDFERNVIIMKSCSDNHVWIGGFKSINTKHLFQSLEMNKPYIVSDLLKLKVEVQNG
jgi:hypothetical protein